MFAVTKLIGLLLEPGNLLFVALVVAAVLMRPHRLRWPLRALCVLFAAIWLTPLADALLGPLEDAYPRPNLPARIDGIVVLGGWEDIPPAAARGGVLATGEGAERLIVAAGLARRYPEARIVFTGGTGDPRFPNLKETIVVNEAVAELGLATDRILIEDRSRNTAENAVFSYQMVRPKRNEVWVLVTSASHMRRAKRCFDKLDWPVIPYPCDYRSTPGWWFRDRKIVDPIGRFSGAMYEWVGLLVYRLYGVA